MELHWVESMSLGNSIIDTKMKETISIYNRLIRSCKNSEEIQVVEEMFDALIDSFVIYVEEAEYLLSLHKASDRQFFREQHMGLLNGLKKIKDMLLTSGASAEFLYEINQTFMGWALNPVIRCDVNSEHNRSALREAIHSH